MVDTGKGIARENIEGLFNMFGKLKRTAEQNSEGIGLGLTFCKQLVEINEGEIKVDSNGVDKGSSFQFTMKMRPEEQDSDSESVDKRDRSSSLNSRCLFHENQMKLEAIQDSSEESKFVGSLRKLLKDPNNLYDKENPEEISFPEQPSEPVKSEVSANFPFSVLGAADSQVKTRDGSTAKPRKGSFRKDIRLSINNSLEEDNLDDFLLPRRRQLFVKN